MGKNRKTKQEGQYSTPNLEENVLDKLMQWQGEGFGMKTPEEKMDDEEIQYIKDHMEISNSETVPTGHLTRVERAYHFLESGLGVGDVLDTNSVFRSFSREPDSTVEYMEDIYSVNEPLVIYRTNGKTPHFNVSDKTQKFPEETESLIETGKMKITKITELNLEKYSMDELRKEFPKNLHLSESHSFHYSKEWEEDWGFNPTPTNVIFVDLEPI